MSRPTVWRCSLLCAAAGAWVFSLLTGQPLTPGFISVSAGGASELSLLAVALGYEVAFVTLHHLYRMFFVLWMMPLGNPPGANRVIRTTRTTAPHNPIDRVHGKFAARATVMT